MYGGSAQTPTVTHDSSESTVTSFGRAVELKFRLVRCLSLHCIGISSAAQVVNKG